MDLKKKYGFNIVQGILNMSEIWENLMIDNDFPTEVINWRI